MVVAGPGTGKTQVLTLRIANILLQTDTPPDGVLALTFTESGAKAMRERLRLYIGTDAYQVPIFTFHGFAQMLISQYPESYERIIGGRPASDIQKIKIIESIVNNGEVKLLRPIGDPSYYVSHLLRIISDLKQEYVTPDKLAEMIAMQTLSLQEVEQYHMKGAHKGKVRSEYTKLATVIAKNHELNHIYRCYEALLTTEKLYDFDDMIVETVKALEATETLVQDLQERYLYILADEHQDVNGAQNKILELLASYHESPNIFAVGDEKQAIYRFQGASLENFLYFTDTFKGTEVISLTENYRSGQTILDAAHSLVEVSDGPLRELRVPLTAAAVTEASIVRRDFSHQAVEDEWLCTAVKNEVKAGTPLHEIAVIVRTNREVEAVAVALRKNGLSVTASADSDILRHPITQTVSVLINTFVTTKSEAALFEVLHHAYWGIATDDLFRVLQARNYQQSLRSIIGNEELLTELGVGNPTVFLKIAAIFVEAQKRELHEAPHRVLEYILKTSGLLDYLMSADPFEGVRVVRRLYDEVQEMVLRDGVSNLRGVSELLETRLAYGLSLTAPYITTSTEAVQVMTAHKSKGLEFNTVFIPHVVDSNWGGATKKRYFNIPLQRHGESTTQDYVEDERRLLYVAITRAKRKLFVTTSNLNAEGRQLIPARLLEEINPAHIVTEDTSVIEQAFSPVESLSNAHQGKVKIDVTLLQHVLTVRGFSATSLNNYLRSPWDYLYRNVLRIPETQPTHMQYGTAVHNTLEYLTRKYTAEGVLLTMTVLKQKLQEELGKLPLSVEEFTRLFEKGLTDLSVYREHLAKSLPQKTKDEFSIRVMFETGIPELPEIPLTGKLDRLDIDEAGRVLRVVDYKTGKPKSRNVIEGKTKDADGAYKRQLVFYVLLLELYGDERYQSREAVLSFVQPNLKGNIVEEIFTITDEEVAQLKAELKTAVQEIFQGTFLETVCDDSVSRYCRLVNQLQRP